MMRKIFFPITLVLLVALASSLPTITSRNELENKGFDDPPRHGLKLLSWFVSKCLDNNMVAKCNPTKGDFGFHQFVNGEKLFPEIRDPRQYTYYTIGNLNSRFSEHLPHEVRRDYRSWNRDSNMDRLVVRYNNNNRRIDQIYISAHYRRSETYLIHRDLVETLRSDYFCESHDFSGPLPVCGHRDL